MPIPYFEPHLEFAHQLDDQDELGSFRSRFVIDEPELIYLDGNSLGRLPAHTADRLDERVRRDWGKQLIRGWNADWFEAPGRVGEKIARLIGAAPGQVVVSDTTSINLFKLAIPALQARPGRTRIVSDALNFPSDLYILQSCIHLLGERHHLHLVPTLDDIHTDLEMLDQAIEAHTALVSLSHVAFKSGYLHDIQAITRRAHQAGALVLWDLSHSVGVVPIELDAWEVDLAVGCTYKYLNGGPGAPAFLYVRKELQESLRSPIWGWFGQQDPFAFDLDYAPAQGIKHFLVSSPPILSTLAMETSLDIVLEAGLEHIRSKSIRMTSYLITLFDQILAPLGFTLGTPRQSEQRGSHVSIRHPEGYRINRALIEELALIPDFRLPDNIRLGLSPLYTSYAEVWKAVDRIRRALVEERYKHFSSERLPVT
jgi:kynureninase